jgi:hypothetical protein
MYAPQARRARSPALPFQQVFDQVYNKIPETLARIGKVKLKNIRRPAEVYRIILGHPFDQGWVEVERIPCGPKS